MKTMRRGDFFALESTLAVKFFGVGHDYFASATMASLLAAFARSVAGSLACE